MEENKNRKMSWRNPGIFLKNINETIIGIFLEEVKDHKNYGSIFCGKLLSWKILILTLKSPGKMYMKKCGNPDD